jgi:hypothetical protein
LSKLIKNQDALISELLKIQYISEIWEGDLEEVPHRLEPEETPE